MKIAFYLFHEDGTFFFHELCLLDDLNICTNLCVNFQAFLQRLLLLFGDRNVKQKHLGFLLILYSLISEDLPCSVQALLDIQILDGKYEVIAWTST